MSEEKAELVKLLTTLRDSFMTNVEALNNYLQILTPPEAGTVIDITNRNGHVYGRIIQKPNELVAVPAENITIGRDDPAVQRFLVPKILEAVKQKYGVNYVIEADNGKIKAFRIVGALDQKTVEELKSPLAWAFEKASARTKTP